MNIVILAGGTGSIALQTGLYELLDKQIGDIDTKIIVNCYDNGLSTGSVRKVMDGKILGPSDLRKNQTTRLQLENPKSPWLNFLNIRFTVESSKARSFCHDKITQLAVTGGISDSLTDLRLAVDAYFSIAVAEKIDYNDFSLANIIYAGLAKLNGYSLRKAATIMAGLMGIKDNVLLNDDRSLFLGAITKSGKRIADEGDIVSWGDKEDPFVDIFFTDADGYDTDEVGTMPHLCEEAEQAILSADLVILSSGTLWSSLIPTYASIGFDRAINNTKAKILMILNRQPDKDSPGQTASEIIDILIPKYFPTKLIHVVGDSSGSEQMNTLDDNSLDKIASFATFNMGPPVDVAKDTRHQHMQLGRAVAQTYFKDYLNSDYYMFDYDDTLVGRGNRWPLASRENTAGISRLNSMEFNRAGKHAIQIGICTGNTVKSVNLRGAPGSMFTTLEVFADGGANKYSYDTSPSGNDDDGVASKLMICVNQNLIIPPETINTIVTNLRDAGIPLSKIDNRGNVLIAIKPIDPEYRQLVLQVAKSIVERFGLNVRIAGRTTVEICKPNLSKIDAIKYVFKAKNAKSITYIGDELDSGNDAVVEKLSHELPTLKCLHVKNPVQTAFFIKTLIHHIERKMCVS